MRWTCCFAVSLLAVAGAPALAADVTPPALLEVELLDTTINVAKGAAAPGVRLKISDDDSGLGSYSVHFQPPGVFQTLSGYDYSETPRKSGSVFIRTAPFSIYRVGGTWELYNVTLCDRVNNCHQYYGDELDAINPTRLVTVVNNRSPDKKPPTAAAGVVATPNISLGSSEVRFRTRMTLDDANSGATGASVCFTSPSGAQDRCASGEYSRPAKGIEEVQEGRFSSPAGVETGVWTITSVYVHDLVGNPLSINDAATIDALFPAGKTMTVTP